MTATDADENCPVTPTDFERPVRCLLGLPFDAIGLDQTVAHLRRAAATRTRCFLSTPNLNFAIACRDDSAFRDSVLRSDLSIVDGMPLVWVARLLQLPIRERVSGAGVFEALQEPHRPALKVYFFGGPPGAAEAAAMRLGRDDRSGMTAVGHCFPGYRSIDEISDEATIAAINRAAPDFVVVALGAKKGQAWIERNAPRLRAPVVSHLGAVVNLSAGTIRRAPPSWQRLGLEWLWRVREEPHLWRRYAADGLAFAGLLATQVFPAVLESRRGRDGGPSAPPALERLDGASGVTLRLRGTWTADTLKPLRDALTVAAREPVDITVDLTNVAHVDNACIAVLLLLYGHQTKAGQTLTVRASKPVQRSLRRHGAGFLAGVR